MKSLQQLQTFHYWQSRALLLVFFSIFFLSLKGWVPESSAGYVLPIHKPVPVTALKRATKGFVRRRNRYKTRLAKYHAFCHQRSYHYMRQNYQLACIKTVFLGLYFYLFAPQLLLLSLCPLLLYLVNILSLLNPKLTSQPEWFLINRLITCAELAMLAVVTILLGWHLVMAYFLEISSFESDTSYDSSSILITTALATNHSPTRHEVANQLAAYAALRENNPSLSRREAAKMLGIPESTLRYWQQRQENIASSPALVAFFSSPEGEAFIHRLLVALQLTMGFVAPTGIRNICQFLELSGLDSFVASSYGSRRQYLLSMEQKIVDFAQEQEQNLCQNMEEKEIAVVEDETYKPGVHLVAIEPVSNFILLEQLADNRQADTWTAVLEKRLEKIPVQVIQGISDEAVGICHHIEKDLKAHHSPDLFHIQQELARAFWPILSNRIHKASQKITKIEQELSLLKQKRNALALICADDLQKPSQEAPGVHQFIKELDEKIKQTSQKKEIEVNQLQRAEEQARQAQQLIQKINSSYHPYNLENGSARTAYQLDQLLRKYFNEIKQLATEAELPSKSYERISKAERLIGKMVATQNFYLTTVQAKVEALSLEEEVEQVMSEQLIPAIYLDMVADKAKDKEQRKILRQKSEQILHQLNSDASPLRQLCQEELCLLQKVAYTCAGLFQRSSSCVEGRNGQLSLRYHNLHRISERRLAALTVIHNYFLKRSDGTTAAERFFGSSHQELFDYLLLAMPAPARPAKKRRKPKTKTYLTQLAV